MCTCKTLIFTRLLWLHKDFFKKQQVLVLIYGCNAFERMKTMECTLSRGMQLYNNCSGKVKKLRAMVHSTEEQLRMHKRHSTSLTQLATKTLPKGLHCLPMCVAAEYYALNSSEHDFPHKENLDDKTLYHYAIFSDNVLATPVVVNSTVFHAKVDFFII